MHGIVKYIKVYENCTALFFSTIRLYINLCNKINVASGQWGYVYTVSNGCQQLKFMFCCMVVGFSLNVLLFKHAKKSHRYHILKLFHQVSSNARNKIFTKRFSTNISKSFKHQQTYSLP